MLRLYNKLMFQKMKINQICLLVENRHCMNFNAIKILIENTQMTLNILKNPK